MTASLSQQSDAWLHRTAGPLAAGGEDQRRQAGPQAQRAQHRRVLRDRDDQPVPTTSSAAGTCLRIPPTCKAHLLLSDRLDRLNQ